MSHPYLLLLSCSIERSLCFKLNLSLLFFSLLIELILSFMIMFLLVNSRAWCEFSSKAFLCLQGRMFKRSKTILKPLFNDSFSQYFFVHKTIERSIKGDSFMLKSWMKRIINKILMMIFGMIGFLTMKPHDCEIVINKL